MSARLWRHPLALLAAGLLILPAVMPWFGTTTSVATEIAIFMLVGFGFNLLLGYTGLTSFGHGAYLGLAAYAAALTQIHLVKGFWVPLAVGLGTAVVLGGMLGFLILRRRGVYFALLTLAFTQMFFYIVYRWTALTGGESGLGGIVRPSFLGLDLTSRLNFYYVTAAIVFTGAFCTWRIVHAPFGTVLQAIRENERRATFLGYDVRRYKWAAFVLSTGLTGLGGVLLVLLKQFAYADLVHVAMSGEILAMTLVGGMRHFLGPAVGAAFFILFREVLTSFTENWLLYFGLLFMGFILFSPDGILGVFRRLLGLLKPEVAELAAMAGRLVPAPGSAGVALTGRVQPQTGELLVEARGLTKRFGAVPAVDGVDLEIRAGELRAIIGPNGAGKTTLFNLLSGLFPPDAGTMRILGRAANGLPADRIVELGLSRSFQILSIFLELSVFENVRLAVQARSAKRFHLWRPATHFDEITRETRELIRLVGLEGVESATASSLSYGGQRLLEIGLALATRPTVLLLDEPLAGLSSAERERVAAFIKGLARGVTVVLIEHDIDRVLALSDRITVLHQGRVIADGTPAGIQEHREVRAAYLGGRAAPAPVAPAVVPAVRSLITVGEVDTFYGKSHILHGVSLEVRAGEVVALLGRNGAGKTATLNTIMGLRPPRRGSIRFCGREIAGAPPETVARLGIGLAPQGRRVFPNLTVGENLAIARMARDGLGRNEEKVVERFPKLRDLWRARAETLSGGEQQMLAIARALVGNVELLLLDEPFEGLAPAVVSEVFEAVQGIRGETAILLVEHNLDLALALADRVYVLDRGAVTHAGPARALLEDLDLRRRILWF
ncbi:MAG: ATP-binding cassette domain-containing protein [Candidatus Methylomirabilia bacterium]